MDPPAPRLWWRAVAALPRDDRELLVPDGLAGAAGHPPVRPQGAAEDDGVPV